MPGGRSPVSPKAAKRPLRRSRGGGSRTGCGSRRPRPLSRGRRRRKKTPRQRRELVAGGCAGHRDASGRAESSSAGRPAGPGRREESRVPCRRPPHLRRNNGAPRARPLARPARRLPQAAPPARRAAGACSSSWLCPDVIQTWQQFDFKGESTDLPDAGSRAVAVTGFEKSGLRPPAPAPVTAPRGSGTGAQGGRAPPPPPGRPPAPGRGSTPPTVLQHGTAHEPRRQSFPTRG